MKNKVALFLLCSFLLLATVVVGCKGNSKDENLANEAITWEAVSSFESYTHPVVEEEWKEQEQDKPLFWSHIDVLVPTTTKAKYQSTVGSIASVLRENLVASYQLDTFPIRVEGKAFLDALLSLELEEYQQDMDFYLDQEKTSDELYFPIFTYLSDLCDSLAYNARGVVSIARIRQNYSGGATHGLDHMQVLNFDLRSGDLVTLSTLFKDPENRDLIALVQRALMLYFGVEDAESLGGQGLFAYDLDELFLSPNFIFEDDALRLYYNPYEIGIYALGSIELELPYEALQPFLQVPYQYLAEEVI